MFNPFGSTIAHLDAAIMAIVAGFVLAFFYPLQYVIFFTSFALIGVLLVLDWREGTKAKTKIKGKK